MTEHIEYQGNFSGSQIDTLLAKIQSSQVFTTEEKTKLASLVNYDDTAITAAVNNKVDKVTGKGLSTNDYSNDEKTKLAAIAPGAEVNVQPNWDQTNSSADDYVKNKPSINNVPLTGNKTSSDLGLVSAEEGKGLSTNDYSDTEKAQVAANAAGVAAVANRGSKNLYDIESMDTAGTYNATHTFTDGVLTVTSSGSYGRLTNRISMKPGTYIFSCDISNVSIAGGTAEIRIAKSASGSDALVRKSFSQAGILSAVFEVTEATDIFLMYYLNLSSTSYTNSADFTKIMIRPATIEDSTYQPYAPTNRELYEMILALQSTS